MWRSAAQIGLRIWLIALAVLLVTAGLAVYIGTRVSDTEKKVLQIQGELNAREAAAEYDRCLLTRVNIVTLVGQHVEHLLETGAGNEEILQFLEDQSTHIRAALDPSTTGLYGWIGGEYLDGSGWVPGADFVPTERPWYTETIRSEDEITFIEPYLDLQTMTTMMTVSDIMSDGKSVIAMDVSLEPIQKIVEQVASETEESQAFVMDENGIVVAHSDKTLLGQDFLRDPDGIGGDIARMVIREGRMQFDLKRPEGFYSVYADRLEGGWFSVSMINADIWYRPLIRTMIVFCVILALVVIFLVFIFLGVRSKNAALMKLNARVHQEEKRGDELQALSEKDRMTGLYDRVNGERRVNELIAAESGGMFMELDVDGFKSINDTYGHQAGDRAIRTVADAMRSTFRTYDILMRLGGDEFGVFAIGVVSREMGETLIRRLFQRIEGRNLPENPGISISVGAAIYSGEGETSFAEMYARTDSAMYESKKLDGNSMTFSE